MRTCTNMSSRLRKPACSLLLTSQSIKTPRSIRWCDGNTAVGLRRISGGRFCSRGRAMQPGAATKGRCSSVDLPATMQSIASGSARTSRTWERLGGKPSLRRSCQMSFRPVYARRSSFRAPTSTVKVAGSMRCPCRFRRPGSTMRPTSQRVITLQGTPIPVCRTSAPIEARSRGVVCSV